MTSFKKSLITMMMLISVITIFIGYASFVYLNSQNQYKETINLSKTVGSVLGQNFAKFLLLKDTSAASDIVSSLQSFSDIEYMILYNMDEKPILKYGKDNNDFNIDQFFIKNNKKFEIRDNRLILYVDAKYQERKLGFTKYVFKIKTINEIFMENILVFIFILIFMLFISYLLSIVFLKKFTANIEKEVINKTF